MDIGGIERLLEAHRHCFAEIAGVCKHVTQAISAHCTLNANHASTRIKSTHGQDMPSNDTSELSKLSSLTVTPAALIPAKHQHQEVEREGR